MDVLFAETKEKLRGLKYPVFAIPSDQEWQNATESWREGLSKGFFGHVSDEKKRLRELDAQWVDELRAVRVVVTQYDDAVRAIFQKIDEYCSTMPDSSHEAERAYYLSQHQAIMENIESSHEEAFHAYGAIGSAAQKLQPRYNDLWDADGQKPPLFEYLGEKIEAAANVFLENFVEVGRIRQDIFAAEQAALDIARARPVGHSMADVEVGQADHEQPTGYEQSVSEDANSPSAEQREVDRETAQQRSRALGQPPRSPTRVREHSPGRQIMQRGLP